MRVVATQASKKLNLKVKELGRVANEGEVFEIADERFDLLNGNNRYKTAFVIPFVEVKEEPVKKPRKPRKKKDVNND